MVPQDASFLDKTMLAEILAYSQSTKAFNKNRDLMDDTAKGYVPNIVGQKSQTPLKVGAIDAKLKLVESELENPDRDSISPQRPYGNARKATTPKRAGR